MTGARWTPLAIAAAALSFGTLFAVARATEDSGSQPPARPATSQPAVRVAPLGKAAPLPLLRRPVIASAPAEAPPEPPPAPAPEPQPKREPEPRDTGIETTPTPVAPVPQPIQPPQPASPPSPPEEEPDVTYDDSG